MAQAGTARDTWKVGLQSPEMETPRDRKPGAQTGGPGWQSGQALSTWVGRKQGPVSNCPRQNSPREGCQAAIRSGRGPKERAP